MSSGNGKARGEFIIITGPSASGKSTLVDTLLERLPNSVRFISTTTRAPRQHEQDGIDYHFMDREAFEYGLARGDFFEHAEVYGNLYGSSREELEELLQKYDFVFMIIDVQGASTLKRILPNATVIFLRPGSAEEIRRRLESERMGVPKEEIEKRIASIERELALAHDFDLIVENREGAFEQTVVDALAKLGLR